MPLTRIPILEMLCAFCVTLAVGCSQEVPPESTAASTSPSLLVTPPPVSTQNALDLLKPNSLDGWEISNFGGEGECSVKDGVLEIETGFPLTGVSSTMEDLPTRDYEISLEARRTYGIDFFCGLTFPVNNAHCTFIVGGWAGSVVGLSCVDGKDASSNETKTIRKFEDNRWYRIRVKVGDSIEAWIDDEQVVDLPTKDREFSLRGETLICKPLGICAFESTVEYRNIILKKTASSLPSNQHAEE